MSTDAEIRKLVKDMPRFLELRDKAVAIGGFLQALDEILGGEYVKEELVYAVLKARTAAQKDYDKAKEALDKELEIEYGVFRKPKSTGKNDILDWMEKK